MFVALGPGVRVEAHSLPVLLTRVDEERQVSRSARLDPATGGVEVVDETPLSRATLADDDLPGFRVRVVDDDHPEYGDPPFPGWPRPYVGGREPTDAERAELAGLLRASGES